MSPTRRPSPRETDLKTKDWLGRQASNSTHKLLYSLNLFAAFQLLTPKVTAPKQALGIWIRSGSIKKRRIPVANSRGFEPAILQLCDPPFHSTRRKSTLRGGVRTPCPSIVSMLARPNSSASSSCGGTPVSRAMSAFVTPAALRSSMISCQKCDCSRAIPCGSCLSHPRRDISTYSELLRLSLMIPIS